MAACAEMYRIHTGIAVPDYWPIWVLDPKGNHTFIALVVQRLQVVKPDKYTHRHTWPAFVLVTRFERCAQRIPIHLLRKHHQWMLRVKQWLQ